MSAPTIGGIVESKCGKCNDVTGHNVMAMVGGAIVKVECRACGSVHKYRPPERLGAVLVAKTARAKGRTTATNGRISGRGAQARAEAERWEKVIQRAINEEVLQYSMKGAYEAASLIRHPVFGLGEVLLCIHPDKMDILFECGVKRLLCNK